MFKAFRFPIRFKILLTLLSVMTVVVSLITFTMANLFHTDKTAYIHDLTSVIALHMAEEARAYLEGYQERLQVFARVIYDPNLEAARKSELLGKLFEDFQEFVAVSVYEDGTERATIYDAKALEAVNLTREDFVEFRSKNPLALEPIQNGEIYVENSTVSDRMPTITLAMDYKTPMDGKPVVLAAIVRLERLLHLAGRSKVFETFLIAADTTLLAHSDAGQVMRKTKVDWIPRLKGIEENRSLGSTLEYTRDGVEMVGGFAPVQFGGLLAGVQIPKTAAYLTGRELLNNLIGVSLLLLVVSAVLSLFWSRRITRPIEHLSGATREVAKGQFDIQVVPSSRDEIGELAGSFNQMASELNAREQSLKQAQAALIQSEKMAAFGQLGAGIAHEVKNPLAGILGYAQLTMRKTEKESPVYKNLEIIEKETKRCKTIIENLMKFARQEKVEFKSTDLNRVVEDTMAIMDHQMSINQVRLEKDLVPNLPPIRGNANQLQQVLMNLMINAQQAMDGKPGQVRVMTRRLDQGRVEVRLSDTGPGIPKEIQAKIFEPFFTTKPAGKGTGLGLSVTYGIIRDHKGEIRVEGEPGEGATFILIFPEETDEETTAVGMPTA